MIADLSKIVDAKISPNHNAPKIAGHEDNARNDCDSKLYFSRTDSDAVLQGEPKRNPAVMNQMIIAMNGQTLVNCYTCQNTDKEEKEFNFNLVKSGGGRLYVCHAFNILIETFSQSSFKLLL